jgi:hypothetical protein
MLDFGIHPGLSGTNALPFIDRVDINTIDLLLISQYSDINFNQNFFYF